MAREATPCPAVDGEAASSQGVSGRGSSRAAASEGPTAADGAAVPAQKPADAGRRRIRVVRTTPVEVYEPSYEPTTTIVEDSYQPSYTERSYSRPRRIMDDDPAPRRIYNRPRYNDNTYISTNSDGRPCRRRSRIVDGYRTVSNGKGCPDEIRETREPVEILYKKTTYKTVYEPKTYTDVTYEKEPYRAGMIEEVVHTQPQPVDTIVETTTTTTTVTD